jgi:hypothetical protein
MIFLDYLAEVEVTGAGTVGHQLAPFTMKQSSAIRMKKPAI